MVAILEFKRDVLDQEQCTRQFGGREWRGKWLVCNGLETREMLERVELILKL